MLISLFRHIFALRQLLQKRLSRLLPEEKRQLESLNEMYPLLEKLYRHELEPSVPQPLCLMIPTEEWKEVGPEEMPEACLKTTLIVHLPLPGKSGGQATHSCHLEAIAVVEADGGEDSDFKCQVAAHDDYQGTLDALGGGIFTTVKIGLQHYMLTMESYSD